MVDRTVADDCRSRKETKSQIASQAGLELDLDVEVCLELELETVGVVEAALLLLRVQAVRLVGVGAAHGNLAAHGAGVGDGPVHGGAVGTDTLKHAHVLQLAVGVSLLERLEAVGLHVLALGNGLLDPLAPGPSRR